MCKLFQLVKPCKLISTKLTSWLEKCNAGRISSLMKICNSGQLGNNEGLSRHALKRSYTRSSCSSLAPPRLFRSLLEWEGGISMGLMISLSVISLLMLWWLVERRCPLIKPMGDDFWVDFLLVSSCGCMCELGALGVLVITRVFNAVTSACRTSICRIGTQ